MSKEREAVAGKRVASRRRKKRTRVTPLLLMVIALAAVILGLYSITKPKPVQKQPDNPGNQQGEDPPPYDPVSQDDPQDEVKTLKENFYTFLLVGTNDDYNADTIMLGAIDMEKLECNVISIPRDSFVKTELANKRINNSYGSGGNSFAEKIESLCDAVYGVSGVYPQYYCVLNMKSFIKVVDVIGGVYFNVPMDMYHPDAQPEYTINLKKGPQVLDGSKALQLVRYRGTALNDFGRINLQKQFLTETLKQVKKNFTVSKATGIIETIAKSIKTNMPVKDMVWFYQNAINKMDLDNNMHFHTMPFSGTAIYERRDYVFLDEEKALELINKTVNPYTSDITADKVGIIGIEITK